MTTVTAENYSPQKLRELILYVSWKSLGDKHFGKTKLNKILFFSDFTAMRQNGHAITGAKYQHLAQGPCPQQMLPALNDLQGDLGMLDESYHGYVKTRPIPHRTANLDLFTGPEIAIVDDVIDDLWPLTNKQVSDLSHETLAWLITDDGQEIPYGTAFLDAEAPTPEDLKWLDEVAASATVGEQA